MATASVTNTFVTGSTILAAAMNTNFADLVSFLNGSVLHRDGSLAMTGALNMGGFKVTNLAVPTVGTDAARKTELDTKLDASANAVSASKWATARQLSLTGDVTGSTTFDGSANASITTVVGNDSHTHDTRYYTESEVNSLLAAKLSMKGAELYNSGTQSIPDATWTDLALDTDFYDPDGIGNLAGNYITVTPGLWVVYGICRMQTGTYTDLRLAIWEGDYGVAELQLTPPTDTPVISTSGIRYFSVNTNLTLRVMQISGGAKSTNSSTVKLGVAQIR